ncbi:MAG: exonuclease domain-containing protein [Ruminococcaceae bacterium]|nr:exonuclease domain-containing protein [Oscillospiraceae bacterium]
MNYIILDLEWDSTFFVKQKRFINQILQIGAVKLDSQFNVIDTFEVVIKSSISKRVTGRFANLTGITNEIMRGGVPFPKAVEMYNAWVGDDTVTMTWSNSDLYTIIENEENLLCGQRFKIEKYLDLQKFIQKEMHLKGYEDKNQVSLALAAEFLEIETDNIDFHTAKDDSLVCAFLLKKCYNAERFEPLIKDTSNPEFFKRLKFKSYCISNLKDKNIDKKYLEFSCPKCSKKAKKVTKWKYSNRWFTANFICDCGEKFNGRVTFKKTYDDLIVRQKICEFKEKKKTEEVKV